MGRAQLCTEKHGRQRIRFRRFPDRAKMQDGEGYVGLSCAELVYMFSGKNNGRRLRKPPAIARCQVSKCKLS